MDNVEFSTFGVLNVEISMWNFGEFSTWNFPHGIFHVEFSTWNLPHVELWNFPRGAFHMELSTLNFLGKLKILQR
jgi:hypothetical protein